MMPRAARVLGMLGLLVAAVIMSAAPADAQLKLGDYTITGDLEGGVRQIYGEHQSSRYNEFRDIPQGLFFPDLSLDIDKPGFYYELRAQDLLENDQNLRFSLGAPGLYRLDIEWHEIQHMFHNQGITPYTGVGGDNLTIDSAVRTVIQGQSSSAQITSVNSLFNSGHREVVGFDRDRGEVKFRYLIGPNWTLRLAYKNERWEGTRPISMLFGVSPGGRPVIELPMPVDWRHDDVRMALEWSRGGNSFEVAYQASIFQNEHTSLTWSNPFRATDAAASYDAAHNTNNSDPARGRMALDPGNQAHYINLSGALQLPAATRLMGNFSYGWWLQDESFLPHTSNDALYTATGANLSLPRRSLDGEMNPILANVVLTNNAIPNVSIKGRYNYYDLNNNTKRTVLPQHTVGDIGQTAEEEIAPRYAYIRQTASADVSFRLGSGLKLNTGYEYKRNDYTHYEASSTDENKVKVSLDIKANNWLKLRPAYIFSDKDVNGYREFTYPSLADRRHFNLASRERHEGKLMAIITPSDRLTLTLEGGVATDDYSAKYGLDEGYNWNAGAELSVTPVDPVTLFVGYAHETSYGKIHSVQNSRKGPASSPDTFFDADAWTMKFTDDYDIVRGGVEFLLYENMRKNQKVTWKNEVSYAVSNGETKNAWDQGTPANITGSSAITRDWPDIKAKLLMISSRLDYQLNKNLTVGVGYTYERYNLDDFTQQLVDVVVDSSVTTRYYTMGDPLRNFEAHTIAAFVRWRF